MEIRYAIGETSDLCPVCDVGVDIAACTTLIRDLCPICETGVVIAARATVTRDLCHICEMGLDIAVRATEQFEIRLHSKYRTLERYIYIKYICLTSIY